MFYVSLFFQTNEFFSIQHTENIIFNMNQTEHRIAQLEEENRLLKAQLERAERKNKILVWKNDYTFRAMFNHSSERMMLIDSKGIIRE